MCLFNTVGGDLTRKFWDFSENINNKYMFYRIRYSNSEAVHVVKKFGYIKLVETMWEGNVGKQYWTWRTIIYLWFSR